MIFLSLFFIISLIKISTINGPLINIEKNRKNHLLILGIVIIILLPLLYYLPYINLRNLFLIDVYETRAKFRLIY